MAFLPDRRRPTSVSPQVWGRQDQYGRPAHIDALQWRPVNRRPSFMPILLTVVAAAVAGFWIRNSMDRPATPVAKVERHAAPAGRTALAERCREPDGTIRNWGNPALAGGSGPIDFFHFLPACNEGGRR
jgi:hypothetical protein